MLTSLFEILFAQTANALTLLHDCSVLNAFAVPLFIYMALVVLLVQCHLTLKHKAKL